jgi:hypothetical protein
LYLWHWPLLIVATAHWDGLSVGRGLLVAAFSFLPAWLTYRLVENPLRFSASLARLPRLALSLGANCTLAGVVAGLVVLLAVPTPTSTPDIESATQSRLGAAVLAESSRDDPAGAPVDRVEWITPDPVEATEDVPDLYADGCQQDGASAEPVSCSYGSDDAGTTIALVGDSKAAQWAPALQILAQQKDWRLVTYTKSRCSFTTAEITIDGEIYESCSDWNDNVLAELTGANRPDYVVTSGGRSAAVVGGGSSAQDAVGAMVAGLKESWDVLISSGVNVIVIADTPDTGFNVYECVSENPDRLTECTYDRQESQGAGVLAQLQAAASPSDVTYVDLNDAICPTARCAPVIGNVLVYRQGSHLTATYVETLAPRVGVALERAMGGDQ